MSSTTAANSVNTDIQPSRLLKVGVGLIYALAAFTLLVASAIPLEAKVLLLCFLIRETRKQASSLDYCLGALYLHTDGSCRLNDESMHVRRVVFFSRHLIVLDVDTVHGICRLTLACDAFDEDTFRHLSRICLMMKM